MAADGAQRVQADGQGSPIKSPRLPPQQPLQLADLGIEFGGRVDLAGHFGPQQFAELPVDLFQRIADLIAGQAEPLGQGLLRGAPAGGK